MKKNLWFWACATFAASQMAWAAGVEEDDYYVLPVTVYDSDPILHPAFSCYTMTGEGCQKGAQEVDSAVAVTAIEACVGVSHGIVESTLNAETKKPKLTTAGKKCFIEEKYFNQLFNYTQGVNEKSHFEMPFSRMENGWWSFNSDFYINKGTSVMGGFFPVETVTDEDILAADPTQTPLATARTKREAEGPTFFGEALRALDPAEGVPVINVFCNGPAWDKGFGCEGNFGNGDVTTTFIQKALGLDTGFIASETPENCVFGWTCREYAPEGWPHYKSGTEIPYNDSLGGEPRWYSYPRNGTGGRNHHFCYELHSSFVYQNGQRFGIRGGDDIWVYIDNKLAVDIGGTHIDAPGYVDLDAFKGGSGKLEAGKKYDLDLFACDRRTTMSNIEIMTNIALGRADGSLEIAASRKLRGTFAVSSLSPSTLMISGAEAAKYAVMDLQGRVVRQGVTAGAETVVPNLMPGTYIVKVARETRRVNVR